jgi:hypothetical protein
VGKLFGWAAGLVGIAALARVLARRQRAHARQARPALEPDPAAALRQKLSDTRAAPVPEAEPPAPEPSETIEERRSRVHAKAQDAIAAMQEDPSA